MPKMNIVLSPTETVDEAGHRFARYPILMGTAPSNYIDISWIPLFYVCTELEWVVWSSTGEHPIDMSADINRSVRRFLSLPISKREQTSCHEFVELLAEREYYPGYGYVWQSIKELPVKDARDLTAGSYVLLCSAPGKSKHAAVSIGHGLYLSVLGMGGSLAVMDMMQMQSCYSGCAVFQAWP